MVPNKKAPLECRGVRSLGKQFTGAHNPHGPFGDQATPEPVVMRNDSRSGQMRSVAQRVSIADSYDMKVMTNGRPNRRINAKVSGPPRHQDSPRSHSRNRIFALRFNVRIINIFLNFHIVVSMVLFVEQLPLRIALLKKIACFTQMPKPNNLTTSVPDH